MLQLLQTRLLAAVAAAAPAAIEALAGSPASPRNTMLTYIPTSRLGKTAKLDLQCLEVIIAQKGTPTKPPAP